ncbi:MAG: HK97 family phage prohead protease [Alphaproteobacteria bacterium]|nr:HK97 family phage prohead protease [Alphaproteobacteria bacterium]
MTMTHFDVPLELKFVADTDVFEGYASVFNVTDNANDMIVKGAFQKSLAAHRDTGRLPPLLWQHDAKQPIGAWRQMYEDEHGLYVEGQLFTSDIPRAKEAYRLLRENVVTGLSIGYKARESHRDAKTGTRVLSEIDLLEVSLVTFPANEMARVSAMKSALDSGHLPAPKEFEAFLRDAGFSRKQAKTVMALGYKSLQPRDAEERGDDALAAIQELARKLYALSQM